MRLKMKADLKDRAHLPIPPPFFFVLCLGVGLLLEFIYPLQIVPMTKMARIIIGGAFLLLPAYFAISAFITLIKHRTPFNPSTPTLVIVQKGAFKFSRNPMYLALLLLIFGIAALLSSLWLFIAVPILFILLSNFAVRPEEIYLSQKFGKEYSAYKAKVRRWI
jgi:protein-S-isoprenylcysteine O-methyltransferase Ste14